MDIMAGNMVNMASEAVKHSGGSRVKSDGGKLESQASPWNILQIKVAENPI